MSSKDFHSNFKRKCECLIVALINGIVGLVASNEISQKNLLNDVDIFMRTSCGHVQILKNICNFIFPLRRVGF